MVRVVKNQQWYQFFCLAFTAFLAWVFVMSLATESVGKGPEGPQADEPQYAFIVSPFEGTFVAGEYPGAPPFVAVGDLVTPDSVVCKIIVWEDMKPLKSMVYGVIEARLVEDYQHVIADEPLFKVLISAPPPPPPPPM